MLLKVIAVICIWGNCASGFPVYFSSSSDLGLTCRSDLTLPIAGTEKAAQRVLLQKGIGFSGDFNPSATEAARGAGAPDQKKLQDPHSSLSLVEATWPAWPLLPEHHCIPEVITSFRDCSLAFFWALLAVLAVIWGLVRVSLAVGSGPRLPSGRQRVPALDGLRTVIVTYVILFHIHKVIVPQQLADVVSTGHWGMQFFFVLMGFVNFRVNAKQDRISLGVACSSLAQRFGRLCPGYHIALLWMYASAKDGHALTVWPLQALFLQSLLPVNLCCGTDAKMAAGYCSVWLKGNYVGWFTADALVCAVCFPMLYNARPRRGWHATAMVLLAVLTLRSSLNLIHVYPGKDMWVYFYVWAPVRVLEYFAGMLLAQLGDELPKNLKSWPGWCYLSDLCLVLVFVVVAGQRSFIQPSGDFFLAPVFGLYILSCSLTESHLATGDLLVQRRGYLDALLSSHLLVEPAQYSFGAYILQHPIQQSLTCLLQRGDPTAPLPAAFWVLHLASCWIAGVAFTKFVENPVARVARSQQQTQQQLQQQHQQQQQQKQQQVQSPE